MKLIADLHLHSKYSRATSRDMDLEHIAFSAQRKGIDIIGTGDFTHPEWFAELKTKLEPAEEGFYTLSNNAKVRFVITGEISNIYNRQGKTRRVHNVVILPSLETAEKINNVLSWQGNLKADGRPILGMDSEELLKIVINTEPQAMFIPAHIWTPWFAVFGSMSGFNSLEEAFGENTKYLAALETGLSSDPKMNWRVSALDKFTLVSNSDAHSPDNIGREANVLDIDFNYSSFREAIVKKDKNKFLYTIEFFPEEGKYHYDGHRLCQVRMSPEARKKVNGMCPVCGKPLTIGVLSRVDELADREEGYLPPNAIPYKSLVPLKEIIADALKCQAKTKAVEEEYQKLINHFPNEFNILLDASFEDLKKFVSENIAQSIILVREGKVHLEPGYDGEYGKVKVILPETPNPSQKELF
ncbi:MAG: DNA helicase UvrD [Parcubacteria group bacterium]|nr:DNA helicase UvrD [Parcubacteria group bacterium]